MKNKMSLTKKKTGVAILCGALLLSMGTTSTFAASPTDSNLLKLRNEVKTLSTGIGQNWREIIFSGMSVFNDGDGKNGIVSKEALDMRVLVKSKNGVKQYSTDGGETWSETAPEGMPAFNGKDGKFLLENDEALQDGLNLMVKIEDGVRLFSTDDGQTWSEKAPEGIKTFHSKDGSLMNGLFRTAEGVEIQVKIEDGVKQYSTDGGETWSETAPEGMPELGGKFPLKHGGTLKGGLDLMVKVENGVRSFSTDGGQTWDEKTPEGASLELNKRF